jgi:gamma-glutamylcyclotransferase (GGCT)/AIG2-like uncharacterized protein YtfP
MAGEQVTFLVRGAHLATIRDRGIKLIGPDSTAIARLHLLRRCLPSPSLPAFSRENCRHMATDRKLAADFGPFSCHFRLLPLCIVRYAVGISVIERRSKAMATPNQHYLFVYGSMRRGERNDIALQAPEAVFVTRAFVRGRLYDQGENPCIALDPLASWITGELYMIAAPMLESVDRMELAAGSFQRTQAVVHDAAGGGWPCWIYLPPSPPAHRHSVIPGGDWVRYRKIRDRQMNAMPVLIGA